jgi:hypothetical protein
VTLDCSCVCHIGGAYRPPCDVPGGCGSNHREERPICPGPCNHRWLKAERHEITTGEPNQIRPHYGSPVWCKNRENDDGIDISCTANIRSALLAMPDLFTHLDNAKAVSTPDKQDRPAKGGHPSASREVDDQDEQARWLWDWRQTVYEQFEAQRIREGDLYAPFPDTDEWGDTITSAVSYLARNLDWALTYLDPDLAFNLGDEILTDHRRLTNLTKTGDVFQHRSAPCPRCQRRTLVHEMGTKYVACTNKACNRRISLDEYDDMVAAMAKSRATVA